jgi:hypothetical protein
MVMVGRSNYFRDANEAKIVGNRISGDFWRVEFDVSSFFFSERTKKRRCQSKDII